MLGVLALTDAEQMAQFPQTDRPRYELQSSPNWVPQGESRSVTVLRGMAQRFSRDSHRPSRIWDRMTRRVVAAWDSDGESLTDVCRAGTRWVRCATCQEPMREEALACWACEMDRVDRAQGLVTAAEAVERPRRMTRVWDPSTGWREVEVVWDGT